MQTTQAARVRERSSARPRTTPAPTIAAATARNALAAGETKVLNGPALLELQRSAGNASVSALVSEQPTVQRGLFDMLGGLLGGGGGLQQQAAGLAGRGVEAGAGALGARLGGPFGGMLAGAGGGLAGAATSLVGGDTAGALGGLQAVGTSLADPFAQTATSMLGSAIGGQAGGLVSGLGGAVGQGLTSVIQGGSPAQAGMGLLGAAAPGLSEMAGKFLSFI